MKVLDSKSCTSLKSLTNDGTFFLYDIEMASIMNPGLNLIKLLGAYLGAYLVKLMELGA